MLALSPQMFQTFNWPNADEATSHEQNYVYKETEQPSELFLHFNPPRAKVDFDHSPPSRAISGDPIVAKKLNHNASERDRRKKINCLYSELRCLLPDTDQTKKLSIPATVSRVLKYVPDLQQQVQRLTQKKEELVLKISRQEDFIYQENKRKRSFQITLATVSATRVGDREVIVQISTQKPQNCAFSDVLLALEEKGLFLISSSSSESFGGRVFYNLHLQAELTHQLDCEALNEKLLSLYEKREEMFR